MNNKIRSFLGWTSIIILSLVPIFLFFTLNSHNDNLSLSTFGKILALMGITLFTLNFILSTRLKFLEEIFGGMDKVYLVHGIVGGIAFMLILAHPILMVAGFLPNFVAAASFFIPGNLLFLDFGLIAIVLLISLMIITFFTRMKYNHWKFTHEFMGLVFIFALLHMFFGNGVFKGYIIFVSVIAVIGLSSFTYSLIVRKKFLKYASYKIKNVRINKNVIELELEPEDKKLQYQSGQFVFLKFYNGKISKEPHPFSISSRSNDQIIRVFIKESGDFTEKLINLKIEEKVSVEGPYGKFNFRNYEKNQIWIAAGIGITPFVGMIEELKENPERNVVLIYTFRENYVITKKDADEMARIKNLKFIPWNSDKLGQINVGKIIEIDKDLKSKEILICGPSQFKDGIIKGLKEIGIKRNKIHEEVFDLK